jgi:hypothetical protein
MVVERAEEGREYPVQRSVYFISGVQTTLPAVPEAGAHSLHRVATTPILLSGRL